jgi:hypothetical protein
MVARAAPRAIARSPPEARTARRQSRRQNARRGFLCDLRAGDRRATDRARAAANWPRDRAAARTRRRSAATECGRCVRPRRARPLSAQRRAAVVTRSERQQPVFSMPNCRGARAAGSVKNRPAFGRRHEQRAQARETVGDDQPEGNEFGERLFDLSPQLAGPFDPLLEEGRAIVADVVETGTQAAILNTSSSQSLGRFTNTSRMEGKVVLVVCAKETGRRIRSIITADRRICNSPHAPSGAPSGRRFLAFRSLSF